MKGGTQCARSVSFSAGSMKMQAYSLQLEFEMKELWNRMQSWNKPMICERRRELSLLINGDVFYAMKVWPCWMKEIFWRAPISDKNTFILVLFLLGNGCSPHVICEWILNSIVWKEALQRQKKRFDQVMWILKKTNEKRSEWYYFDLFYQRYLFLDGTTRSAS